MTKEEKIEFARCAKDPIYFAKNHWKGFVAGKGEIDEIPMFKFQEHILKHIHNNDLNLIKKSRQMYVSTTMAIYVAWMMIFKFDKSIAIISNDMSGSRRLLDTIRRNLENFRVGFKFEDEVVVDNKSEIRLANGSNIKVFAGNKHAGRGYTIDFLIFDEAAYIRDLEYIWMGLGMATSAVGGKIVFASTPNKPGDLFYKIWEGSKKGENDFKVLEIDWTANPRYTQELGDYQGRLWSPWYNKQCELLHFNEDAIDRELWGLFVSGVRPIVPKRINFRLESEVYDKIIEKIDETGTSLTDYMKELIKKDLDLD
jgi:hypothetical protein